MSKTAKRGKSAGNGLLSLTEAARKLGMNRQRLAVLVQAGRIEPAPVRLGSGPRAPYMFSPSFKRLPSPGRTAAQIRQDAQMSKYFAMLNARR